MKSFCRYFRFTVILQNQMTDFTTQQQQQQQTFICMNIIYYSFAKGWGVKKKKKTFLVKIKCHHSEVIVTYHVN